MADGLNGRAYLDKVAHYARFQQAGSIAIDGETDRIYLDTTHDCQIVDAKDVRFAR